MSSKLPYVVAEVAQGYEGQKRLVELYCAAANATQADAIKFQIFAADELALEDYKYYSLFKGLELPMEVWKSAVESIHQAGKEFYSDVFGLQSLEELHGIGVDGFKVHSTDVNNLVLLKRIASTKKKVLLSTGGTEPNVIDRAVEVLGSCPITLMHGFQAEPTDIADNHLLRIKTIKARYGLPVGFQDHTDGEHPLAHSLPFLAMGLGATLIEKHFTLSRVAKIEDYVSALTAEEFKNWCAQIKEAGFSLGQEEWKLTDKELKYKSQVRRAVCTTRSLQPGHTIQIEDVTLKRSGNENAIYDVAEVVGRKVQKPVDHNRVIEKGVLT
ncbi:MAG: N-acetylneuraminate synthase family protein [Oligoflexia bacterium]|nr:N-acetylneuraminate synthase family protein [Oligoflexia bacterium]